MLRRVMGVAKIKIPQVDRQRQQALQNPHGIVPVNREITKGQKRSERAAFPKANWDHALARAFRCDPLDEEAEPEDQTPAQADDFPRIERDAEHLRLGEELQAVHKAETFRQIDLGDQLFIQGGRFPNSPFLRRSTAIF